MALSLKEAGIQTCSALCHEASRPNPQLSVILTELSNASIPTYSSMMLFDQGEAAIF